MKIIRWCSHRVIEGFMAQTGDVEFGNSKDFSERRVGTGGSDLGLERRIQQA